MRLILNSHANQNGLYSNPLSTGLLSEYGEYNWCLNTNFFLDFLKFCCENLQLLFLLSILATSKNNKSLKQQGHELI